MIRCFLPLMLTVALGCGGDKLGLPTAPVSGTVAYRAKPLSGGRIVFFHPSGQAVGADIGVDGSFRMVAFQGKNQVAVEYYEQPNGGEGGPRSLTARKSLIPSRYAEFGTSGLMFEVKPGDNTADFDLASK